MIVFQPPFGKCQNCKFVGILGPKVFAPRGALTSLSDTPDTLPVLLLCKTCFNTPLGHASLNMEHKRLPDAEYLVK